MKLPPRPVPAVLDGPGAPSPVAPGPAGVGPSGEEAGRSAPGREWVTGNCWRCDGTGLPVMWLGPVQSQDHGHAPFHACEPCMQRLEDLIQTYNAQR